MKFITILLIGFLGLPALADTLSQSRAAQMQIVLTSEQVQSVLKQKDRLVGIQYVPSFAAAMSADYVLSFESESCENSQRSVVKVVLDTYKNVVAFVHERICSQ